MKKNKKLRNELNERIWDKMEQEAGEDIKAGRVSEPFETAEELLAERK